MEFVYEQVVYCHSWPSNPSYTLKGHKMARGRKDDTCHHWGTGPVQQMSVMTIIVSAYNCMGMCIVLGLLERCNIPTREVLPSRKPSGFPALDEK